MSTGATTEYAGNYIYDNSSGTNKLKFFSHPEGYIEPNGNSYKYVYQYKDHLGSVRLSYSDLDSNGAIDSSTEILQERNTYPFGLEHRGYNNVINGTENNYQTYLGQEMNEELGLNWLTFRYRNYMPDLGRFFGVDPVSEEYYSISTNQFAHNSPIWKIELEGLEGATTTGDGNDDVITHEPVKNNQRVSRGTPFIVAGSNKVVQETTKQVVKESAKKSSGVLSKVLNVGGRALGAVVMFLTPTSLDEPQPSDFMPRMSIKDHKIDERLRLDDRQVRTQEEKRERSPIERINDDADSFITLDHEDNTAVFYHKHEGETITIGGDFNFDGDTLTIDNFDVEGSSSNKIGIKGIRQIMKKLGTELDVKTIIIRGAPRTTGANPGKITELPFDIDKL